MFLSRVLRSCKYNNNPFYYNVLMNPISRIELTEYVYKYNREIIKYNPSDKNLIYYDHIFNVIDIKQLNLLMKYINQIKH